MWFTWPKGSSSPAPGREILLSAELLAMAEGLPLLSFISEAWLLAMQLHSVCSLWLSVVPFWTATNLAATLPKLLLCSFCSNQDWKTASDVPQGDSFSVLTCLVCGCPGQWTPTSPGSGAALSVSSPAPTTGLCAVLWPLIPSEGFLSSAVTYAEYST